MLSICESLTCTCSLAKSVRVYLFPIRVICFFVIASCALIPDTSIARTYSHGAYVTSAVSFGVSTSVCEAYTLNAKAIFNTCLTT